MAVINFREILPRTFSHKFGESPTATRVVNATLDGATNTQDVLNAIGIFHGALHPEYPYLVCTNGSVTETDAFHAEVTYTYEVPQEGTDEFQPNPLSRPDVWTFSTGGAEVPCLYYYAGNGIAPLINSAGDFIEDVANDGLVARSPAHRAVEVDEMKASCTALEPVARHDYRVFGEHGDIVHVALSQPHAAAILEVDCRDQQHRKKG